MRVFKLFAVPAVLASLVACGEPVEPPAVIDETTARTISQGELVGFTDQFGAQVWRAVPYAAAPVGDLRWRAPRPAEAFEARFEALEFGPRCPQITNALDEAEGLEAGQIIGSEDCLTLDIYAPPGTQPGDDLPVMVWIHGGANTWGRSSAYDGRQLAMDRDVIVIAMQYRLGPLGWLAHPALRSDSETNADRAANFAVLDMIAALEWVQDNADAFGGDAGRVTIFGESAGGHNVAALLASEMARGLFHAAIIQSGSTRTVTLEEAEQTAPNSGIDRAAVFAGPDADAATMRATPLNDVYEAYREALAASSDMPRMIEDGVVIPQGGILGAAQTPGGFAPVPVITGANLDEMKLYGLLNPQLVNRIGPFIWAKDRDVYDAVAEYPSRIWRALAVDELAVALNGAGHDQVWAYRFDWDEGGRFLVTDLAHLMGAAHSMEIPFVFNHFEFYGQLDPILFNNGNFPGRAAVARDMGRHWGSLAANGVPEADWPAWSEQGVLMRFDTPEDGGSEILNGVETAALIASDLASDERLSAELKCAVAAAILSRDPQLRPDFDAVLTC
ncbi:carboxylesterase family protein [Maricaulis sp.]|uniref:carboxylesterase/lipase family protein n=1 Tax=Maricaulis sp. TaxID=1486257 RepID=UPI002628249D|nr:carboxylesterase family protein [Maricaulis sp.]